MRHIARFQRNREAVSLEKSKNDGAITGVLRELTATLIAFFLQLLPRLIHRTHQLHDNRCRDVGHDAKGKNTHTAQCAAREHGKHTADARVLRCKEVLKRVDIDPRHGNISAKAIHDQKSDGEEDALTKLFGLTKGRPVEVCRHLLCC